LADLAFARRADGALHIGIGRSLEGITLPNWYLSGDRVTPRIKELALEDGSVLETAALNGLAVVSVEATTGDDVLVGTGFGDAVMSGVRISVSKSRRWRHGERTLRAAKNMQWRKRA
jgi:hypothetical protein